MNKELQIITNTVNLNSDTTPHKDTYQIITLIDTEDINMSSTTTNNTGNGGGR